MKKTSPNKSTPEAIGSQVVPRNASPSQSVVAERRQRVAIEHVRPEIDGGRHPIKRVVGDTIVVEADLFADGHDIVRGVLRYRHERDNGWNVIPLTFLANDRWRASFQVTELGHYRYSLMGWVDHFATWQRDMRKRVEAKQDIRVDLLIGKRLLEEAASRAQDDSSQRLKDIHRVLSTLETRLQAQLDVLLGQEVADVMMSCVDPHLATTYDRELAVVVDRARARFSAWYEMFPRSAVNGDRPHGTFRDCESRLPYIADMGFDVLYLPPIHPIGETHRKGPNNNPHGDSKSVGSPWAIGARDGGHMAIHPELGNLDDFKRLMVAAKAEKILSEISDFLA